MRVDDSVISLYSQKDKFSISLKILKNVGSLVPNQKIDANDEYGVVVVKIDESSDFLGLGEFVEFHKLILDITPRVDGSFAFCATLCFPLQDPELGPQDHDEDEPQPDFVKLFTAMPGTGVKEFLDMVRQKKFFYAIFSTPYYDGRVVVKHKTGLIAAKAYEERLYKMQ